MDGGGAGTNRNKDVLIREAENDLCCNKITIIEFLNRITKKSNCIATNMAHFQLPVGFIYESGDESDNTDESENTLSVNETVHEAETDQCRICADKKRNVIFLPCRDFKCCDGCASTLAAHGGGTFSCPFCKCDVLNTIVAFI